MAESAEQEPRQLEGRVAVVTGAGRGIGAGIARVLAERGAAVVVTDIDEDAARSTAEDIVRNGGVAAGFRTDVTDRKSLAGMADSVIEKHGKIDICVPNAGVVGAPGFTERTDFTDADWDMTNDVNLRGMVNTAEVVAAHMKERRQGKIVNIASQGGRAPRGADVVLGRQLIPYLVSKAGCIQWTHLLAQDLGKYNINVNCVCPGTVWTEIWEAVAENRVATTDEYAGWTAREVYDSAIEMRHPLAVEQTPEDIGHAVAFFASDEAAEITGQALNVNAGSVLS
ncbi:MAG: SDR family oxidoreductase [Chloroflexi bacterium]|nr:SDR family oxidoreductase [Chloroflexota bacterium]